MLQGTQWLGAEEKTTTSMRAAVILHPLKGHCPTRTAHNSRRTAVHVTTTVSYSARCTSIVPRS